MFRRNGLLVPDGDVDALFGILPLVGHFQVDHVEEEVAITLIHAGFYRFNYRLMLQHKLNPNLSRMEFS